MPKSIVETGFGKSFFAHLPASIEPTEWNALYYLSGCVEKTEGTISRVMARGGRPTFAKEFDPQKPGAVPILKARMGKIER